MKRTYHGSCHCQTVRFEVDLDLEAGTSKCNCTFCTKNRYWKAFVQAGDVRVLQGDDELTDYQWGPKDLRLSFCRRCGTRPFGTGHLEDLGGDFYAINVAVLDDLDPTDWANAPTQVMDGAQDAWDKTPAETRHL